LRRKSFYLAFFAAHFFFVGVVSSRELFWFLSHSPTILPPSFNSYSKRAEDTGSNILLQNPGAPRTLQKSVTTYVHLAGIESGYGFFAPNVPGTCKLVFELHYPDGRTESRVPAVSSHASGLRVATLLDKIGRPQYDSPREVIIKMLASAVWREHSDATMIRAVFGVVTLPTADEFEHGVRASSEFLYSYDFAFQPAEPKQPNP
jgi:hypothetical protein